MKNMFRFFLAVPIVMAMTCISGCGEASNTVEMPATPAAAPKSGPVTAGTDGGDGGGESNDAQPTVTAPPAPAP